MKKVLLDIDGVLRDFVGRILFFLDIEYGIKLRKENVTKYDLSEVTGLSVEELRDLMYYKYPKEIFLYAEKEPYFYLNEKFFRDNNVLICTNQPAHLFDITAQWLDKNIGIEYFAGIIFTSHKYLIEADYMIDDNLSQIERWKMYNKYGIGIVYDQYWNRSDSNSLHLDIRAENWNDIYKIFGLE
jgi:5'(3')-deoxyribonucleotidase